MHLQYAPLPERPLALVAAGGLVAAILDIAFACLYWALDSNVPATRILQSVAAGALGRSSFDGGAVTAAYGLALHLLIVLAMAAAYYVAAGRWFPLRERPFRFGGAYGLLLYVIMNYVVVPVSRAEAGPDDPLWVALGVAAHVFLVGIPIALAGGRAAAAQLPSHR